MGEIYKKNDEARDRKAKFWALNHLIPLRSCSALDSRRNTEIWHPEEGRRRRRLHQW